MERVMKRLEMETNAEIPIENKEVVKKEKRRVRLEGPRRPRSPRGKGKKADDRDRFPPSLTFGIFSAARSSGVPWETVGALVGFY